MMFTYTIVVTLNNRTIAVLHPETHAEALDALRTAEDYAAKQCGDGDGYAVTLTAEASQDKPERTGNMARMSIRDKAIAYAAIVYAAERGINLTVEDDMSVFDPDDNTYTVEVWSLPARLSETGRHIYFAHGNTEVRAWADALAYMQRLVECPADCTCRDQDQDQD